MVINLRALRGAPITVFFAMLMHGQQVGVNELCTLTGYSEKTVSSALKTLAIEGLAARLERYDGWLLTAGGQQLALTWQAPEQLEDPGNRKFSGSTPTTTALKDSLIVNEDSEAEAVVKDDGNRKISGSLIPPPEKPSDLSTIYPQLDLETLKVLTTEFEDYRVGAPTCYELASDPRISPKFARAHMRHGRRRKDGIGLVVHRLRCHDPPPKDPEDADRYVSGEFAEFIEH